MSSAPPWSGSAYLSERVLLEVKPRRGGRGEGVFRRVPTTPRLGPVFCWHRMMMVVIMANMCCLYTHYNVLELVSQELGVPLNW